MARLIVTLLPTAQAGTQAGTSDTTSPDSPCAGSITVAIDDTLFRRWGKKVFVTYQPANRYWPFQWLEFGAFLALAVLLSGVAFWRIRHVAG